MQTKEMDDFFGDQFSNQDSDGQNDVHLEHFGAMGRQEIQAEHEKRRNLSYHESFDISKELKLQDGFEAAYRDHISDAKEIGLLLGKRVYLHHCKNSNGSSISSIIPTVKKFLEQEQINDPSNEKLMNIETVKSILK